MTALTSGLNFLSGIALQFGTLSADAVSRSKSAKPNYRRAGLREGKRKILSERQKKELLDSIRHDDWAE